MTCLTSACCVERLTSFLHQKVDQSKSRQRISPPPSKETIQQQASKQSKRHVGTGDATGCIRFERSAPNTFGDPKLSLPQERHDDGSCHGQAYSPPGSFWSVLREEAPSAVANNVGSESKQADGGHPRGSPFGVLNPFNRAATLLNKQSPEQDAACN